MNKLLTRGLKYGIKKPNIDYVFCDNGGKPFKKFKTSFKTALKGDKIKSLRFYRFKTHFCQLFGYGQRTVNKLSRHSQLE